MVLKTDRFEEAGRFGFSMLGFSPLIEAETFKSLWEFSLPDIPKECLELRSEIFWIGFKPKMYCIDE